MRAPVMPGPYERPLEGLVASSGVLAAIGTVMALGGNVNGVWIAVAGTVGTLLGWRDVWRARRRR